MSEVRMYPLLPERKVEALKAGRFGQQGPGVCFKYVSPRAGRIRALQIGPQPNEPWLGWIVERFFVDGAEQLVEPTPLALCSAGIGDFVKAMKPSTVVLIVTRLGTLNRGSAAPELYAAHAVLGIEWFARGVLK